MGEYITAEQALKEQNYIDKIKSMIRENKVLNDMLSKIEDQTTLMTALHYRCDDHEAKEKELNGRIKELEKENKWLEKERSLLASDADAIDPPKDKDE